METKEFRKFMELGKLSGVQPQSLVKLTTDHVWNGGDSHDLKWVDKAMQEMGIRPDLAKRWWHSWRSYLQLPVEK